jgi:hypothetical protein
MWRRISGYPAAGRRGCSAWTADGKPPAASHCAADSDDDGLVCDDGDVIYDLVFQVQKDQVSILRNSISAKKIYIRQIFILL